MLLRRAIRHRGLHMGTAMLGKTQPQMVWQARTAR